MRERSSVREKGKDKERDKDRDWYFSGSLLR